MASNWIVSGYVNLVHSNSKKAMRPTSLTLLRSAG